MICPGAEFTTRKCFLPEKTISAMSLCCFLSLDQFAAWKGYLYNCISALKSCGSVRKK